MSKRGRVSLYEEGVVREYDLYDTSDSSVVHVVQDDNMHLYIFKNPKTAFEKLVDLLAKHTDAYWFSKYDETIEMAVAGREYNWSECYNGLNLEIGKFSITGIPLDLN